VAVLDHDAEHKLRVAILLYLASLLHAFPARNVVRYVKVPVL
jgi:hypothetical protein